MRTQSAEQPIPLAYQSLWQSGEWRSVTPQPVANALHESADPGERAIEREHGHAGRQ